MSTDGQAVNRQGGDLEVRAARLSAKLKEYSRQLKAATEARVVAEKETREAWQLLVDSAIPLEKDE